MIINRQSLLERLEMFGKKTTSDLIWQKRDQSVNIQMGVGF